jgi:SHAQKYF class myb-like DNA-binding protein
MSAADPSSSMLTVDVHSDNSRKRSRQNFDDDRDRDRDRHDDDEDEEEGDDDGDTDFVSDSGDDCILRNSNDDNSGGGDLIDEGGDGYDYAADDVDGDSDAEVEGAGAAAEEGEEEGWTDAQHEAFVSAVFEIGLKNASPAVVIENMTHKDEPNITSERVKSKLQKYRNNQEKSKHEFMTEYREFRKRVKAMESTGAAAATAAATSMIEPSTSLSPMSLLEMMGTDRDSLAGGDLAGYLTYSVMKERERHQHRQNHRQYHPNLNPHQTSHHHYEPHEILSDVGHGLISELSDGAMFSTRRIERDALEFAEHYGGKPITFPVLTEKEKTSSLGLALSFVRSMFGSMASHIMNGREPPPN